MVEITVWDTSAVLPVVREPDPARIGQHGMEIVNALCRSIQIVPREIGKQITVRLALSDAAAV
ncbi:hypothetical protein [Streptomyces sp. RKAG290]|uniref:hypothetical protein n=1 Tax=Streptomyces sp. RKAG290 TaxID=2888348 RepID=UPI0020347B60|nr:hypothetical protein [Streptomyces sp. RKAG290]MCM2410767.1 hypothetical protein [Streptomyces sp. RKAG290]